MSDAAREAARRTVPHPVGPAADWYRFCARGELRFQRCAGCDRRRHPPRFVCAACGSPDWDWEPSAGTGTVFSWTVTHRATLPAYAEATPFAILVVEMDAGVRVVGGLRDAEPDQLELGLPVEAVVEPVDDQVGLLFFRPRG